MTQGEAALADLARHPSTAKFIATKFVRHFVADDPPPALVARLARVLPRTDGDLKAVALALLGCGRGLEGAADEDALALRIRGRDRPDAGADPERSRRYLGNLNVLGQPLWSPAGPNGFADSNDVWASPEGIKLRLDLSAQIASRSPTAFDPRDLIEVIAGDAASSETRQTIERAESRQQAMALLLMSPEFQRR